LRRPADDQAHEDELRALPRRSSFQRDNFRIIFDRSFDRVDHQLDATCASHDRRLPVWCDPLPDRVFSASALHLQLHQLPKDVRQRFRIEHAGRVARDVA